MKHSKQENVIFSTKDYGIFKSSHENRIIKSQWVRELTKSMIQNGFYPYKPILVNEKLIILDGHHRYEAAQIAKVPIYFFIDKSNGTDFEKMMKTNEMIHPWQKGDSIPGLVARKYESYIVLDKFQKQFPDFKLTEQLMMLSNGGGDVDKLKFTRGQWIHKDEKLAKKWASDLMKLKPYFKEGYNKSIFVRAMIDIFVKHPEFNFEEFFHKVQLRQSMIHMCGTKESYKEMVENIYNYRRNNNDKINLRF